MKRQTYFLWILLTTALAAENVAAQTCPIPQPPNSQKFPYAPPTAAFTHTAIANGNWHLTSIWNTGTVPGAGAIVCIPAGRSVTYRTIETNSANIIRYIQADGEFRIGIQDSYKLYVDTIYVNSTGSFIVGAPGASHVVSNKTVEVVFKPWNGALPDLAWDPKRESLGLIAMGQVKLYGMPKTHMVPMTRDALKTETSLVLDSVPNNWKENDRLVLPGSYFRQVTGATSSQDEVLEVSDLTVTGTTVNLKSALVHDHIRPGNFRLHVANLTRNLIFRSEPPAVANPERYRGHIMLMNSNVELQNVALVELGRTDKRIPLDDFQVDLFDDPATPAAYEDYSITPRADNVVVNRRGRYALHFHKIGIQPGQSAPSKVGGSVVDGAVGWGFVNHSSHVDFTNNVAYNFNGAGFVTEFGDELGTYSNNIAIRGIGDGIYDPVRSVFQNPARPQPLADFAFRGDGFWFQGPALRAIDNVAAGCDGAGMMWFATGSPDVENTYTAGSGRTHNRYSFFPGSALATVYASFPGLQPRYWNFGAANEKLVIADLPILQNDGFEAYGNFVGHRLRFNNHDSIAWYGEVEYDLDINNPLADGRVEQKLGNQTLWNNQYAFNLRYVSETLWENTTAVNRLDHIVVTTNPPQPGQIPYGAEFFLAVKDITFNNLTIDGYESASLLESGTPTNKVRGVNILFLGLKDYKNYATEEVRWGGVTCVAPVFQGIVEASEKSSRKVEVQTATDHLRYVARYRAVGAQQWRMATATATLTTTAITLTNLQNGVTYQVQVAAGCKDVLDLDGDNNFNEETAPSLFFTTQTFTMPNS